MTDATPLVILGGGGHAGVVRDCLDSRHYRLIGCLDDAKPIGATLAAGTVIGRLADLKSLVLRHRGLAAIVAIGDNMTRRRVVGEVEGRVPSLIWATVVHPSATISPRTEIGPGTVVVAGAVVNGGSRLGCHVLINTGSLVDHDNDFGDFSSTGPGVSIGGNVSVGHLSHIGIGASIKHGIHIGANCVIGGKAYVDRDVDNNLVCFGVPARPRRTRLPGAAYL
jgi:acetyltransferase EpsM